MIQLYKYILPTLLGLIFGGVAGYYVGVTKGVSEAFNNLSAHFRIRNR